ncbi:DUF6882 domain-containing protein [uncultured Roseovarius sp.]|uniref:DUF6882 domain-containing protein n=1 Tax=uncultured Roseovarius sp. TaxID=293344 RepID=UPI00261BAC90|nr:DUF6882 domain-containing protein [uncultured Roseovarius sp.]
MRDFLTEFVNRKADQGIKSIPKNYKKLSREAKAYVVEVKAKNVIADASAFELDMETGALELQFADGPPLSVVAQVAGTFSDDGSFMWGWGHPSVPQPLQQAAWAAQRYGDRQEIEELLTRGGEATRKKAEEYTAIAAYLAHADGVFIGDHGGGGSVCIVWFYPDNTKPYE